MKCHICKNTGVVSVTYESSLQRKCHEIRCASCARCLRNSEDTIILDETYLGEGDAAADDSVTLTQLLHARSDNQPDPITPDDL